MKRERAGSSLGVYVRKWRVSAGLSHIGKKISAIFIFFVDFQMINWSKLLAWHYVCQPPLKIRILQNMALSRGSVVVLRRSGSRTYGLVWRLTAAGMVVLPIVGRQGKNQGRHRAEVRIDELADWVSCGASLSYPVIMCHQPRTMTIDQLAQPEALGEARPALLARVAAAIGREAVARQMEDRFAFRAREVWA